MEADAEALGDALGVLGLGGEDFDVMAAAGEGLDEVHGRGGAASGQRWKKGSWVRKATRNGTPRLAEGRKGAKGQTAATRFGGEDRMNGIDGIGAQNRTTALVLLRSLCPSCASRSSGPKPLRRILVMHPRSDAGRSGR